MTFLYCVVYRVNRWVAVSIDRSIVAKLDDVLATFALIWDHFSIMDAVELRQPSSRGRGSPGCNLIVSRVRRRGRDDDGNSQDDYSPIILFMFLAKRRLRLDDEFRKKLCILI